MASNTRTISGSCMYTCACVSLFGLAAVMMYYQAVFGTEEEAATQFGIAITKVAIAISLYVSVVFAVVFSLVYGSLHVFRWRHRARWDKEAREYLDQNVFLPPNGDDDPNADHRT